MSVHWMAWTWLALAPASAPAPVPTGTASASAPVSSGSVKTPAPTPAPRADGVTTKVVTPAPSPTGTKSQANGSVVLPPEFNQAAPATSPGATQPLAPSTGQPVQKSTTQPLAQPLGQPTAPPNSAPSSGQVVPLVQAEPSPALPGDYVTVGPAGQTQASTPGRRAGPVVENHARTRTAILREPPAELVYVGERKAPQRTALMTLAYRHFAIVDGLDRQQGWHVIAVEITPLRRYFRLNFATEIGIEGGDAAANHDRGDFMAMEKIGLGLQYPGWVTPFFEFQAGAGVGRIELFDRNDLGIMMSTGTDIGVQWAVARGLFVMAAVGWLRPVVMTTEQTIDQARAFNRGTFKVGVGF